MLELNCAGHLPFRTKFGDPCLTILYHSFKCYNSSTVWYWFENYHTVNLICLHWFWALLLVAGSTDGTRFGYVCTERAVYHFAIRLPPASKTCVLFPYKPDKQTKRHNTSCCIQPLIQVSLKALVSQGCAPFRVELRIKFFKQILSTEYGTQKCNLRNGKKKTTTNKQNSTLLLCYINIHYHLKVLGH